MMRTYLKVGIAFYLIVVAGLIGASAEDEPIKEQPPKVAAVNGSWHLLQRRYPPERPRARSLGGCTKEPQKWNWQREYEWTNSRREPLKYALKVYHDGKKIPR